METREQKIERLRAEKEEKEALKKKYRNEEFELNDGFLSRYGWGENILHTGMIVKVLKPDKTWRRGQIEYINLENGIPKIGVVCGKNRIKFEKKWGEVVADQRIEEIILWEKIEVPERLKKMSTANLLREYRKMKLFDTDEGMAYKKELYLREHIGPTGAKVQKEIRRKKAKERHGKRKR